MKRPSRSGDYESPYTTVRIVDGVYYLVVDRRRGGFTARKLTAAETSIARRALDEAHADLEARLGGRSGKG